MSKKINDVVDDQTLTDVDNPFVKEAIIEEQKKYMYKPLRKGEYVKIKFVQSIFDENKSKGWLDTEPKGVKII